MYIINEIFYSLQGEGSRTGTANIFIRFTGCNLKCMKETHGFDCDTEFVSGRNLSLEDIYKECQELSKECRWIILTGGEPALQVDDNFIDFFHDKGYKLAIETNGSIHINEKIDWITVSPKVAEHAIRQKFANEVKYVRAHGQGIPKTAVKSDIKLISVAFEGDVLNKKNLSWCIKLVKENPEWGLTIQNHKIINIR